MADLCSRRGEDLLSEWVRVVQIIEEQETASCWRAGSQTRASPPLPTCDTHSDLGVYRYHACFYSFTMCLWIHKQHIVLFFTF